CGGPPAAGGACRASGVGRRLTRVADVAARRTALPGSTRVERHSSAGLGVFGRQPRVAEVFARAAPMRGGGSPP
ncbi:hypothetical protein, partial [Burkholderia pseudomallei]|uniref:hypothetical protein n=1 Tax=Burkholderia pseudomallei TaxID=28450 RepID=UPI001C4D1E3B